MVATTCLAIAQRAIIVFITTCVHLYFLEHFPKTFFDEKDIFYIWFVISDKSSLRQSITRHYYKFSGNETKPNCFALQHCRELATIVTSAELYTSKRDSLQYKCTFVGLFLSYKTAKTNFLLFTIC